MSNAPITFVPWATENEVVSTDSRLLAAFRYSNSQIMPEDVYTDRRVQNKLEFIEGCIRAVAGELDALRVEPPANCSPIPSELGALTFDPDTIFALPICLSWSASSRRARPK